MTNIFLFAGVGIVTAFLGVSIGLWLGRGRNLLTKNDLGGLGERMESFEKSLREESAVSRREQADAARLGREEMQSSIGNLGKLLGASIKDGAENQAKANEVFGKTLKDSLANNAERVDKLTTAVSQGLSQGLEKIQKDNEQKLEVIRKTVDEKLHETLEKRLGESFKLVSQRLENVQKGLGEMQSLASGVGDLKKVLTNVKTRGIWGEVLLGNLLEQVLSPEQYEANVATTQSSERVEFAIRLPGRGDDNAPTWIPIDSKFPKEDYERLLQAQETGNSELALEAGKALEGGIRRFAQDISEKYLSPPKTTDFGIMFLPSEGLYAEVIRRTQTMELLQRKFHILVTGPTTLSALLNSLQMGFKTLAIQKRSGEVWETLGAVKTEFEKYGELMEKVKKKLDEASNTIDLAGTRTKAINRKLKGVERLSDEKAAMILPLEALEPEQEEESNTVD